ncbi:MAG: sugar ABC transporter ATP-binding protein [Tissierellia bacterium]|nr:sugar ABC transporter ATP-binding protein [Tissierellia bacterium]
MNLLKIDHLSKSYGSNKVLDDISISIEKGSVHGLIGENGAGKSTLMNILFGMPVIQSTGGYEGSIVLDGVEYNPKTPEEAMKMGIGMVHQEFMLIPGFTVTENIKLNRENTSPTVISKVFGKNLEKLNRKEMKNDAEVAIQKLELNLNPDERVNKLPVGYMQFVEIAREIDKKDLKLLILDEPTAVLTESEAKTFLEVIEKLSNLGISILFITHRLEEIKSITDSITVLRDGKIVGNYKTEDVSIREMAKLMVGRDVDYSDSLSFDFDNKRELSDETILELIDFSVDMPSESVDGINLEVKKGEILGIGGLAGQGKIGVANGIIGLYPTTGKVIKDGVNMPLNKPRNMLDAKIAFLSEDRKNVGLLLDHAIDYNIAYTSIEINNGFIKNIGPIKVVDKKGINDHAIKMIEELDIRCQSPKQHTRRLSGGNQQKVCIARALTQEPEILLVSEPTRGIDIGAKNLVLETLLKLNREKGVTIIITSSELAELKQVSDRIAIVTDGKISAILPPDSSDEDFGLAMSGELEHKEVI